jgi:A/G-specific adenine glycosylase
VSLPPARRAAIRRRLLAWYDAGHRDLPWRFPQRRADPYRVWLSEVMLQQTQVVGVLPYYRRFVERWPTLAALAAARDGDVLAAWSGLGYYARCRNLLAAAREALRLHGSLPASLEELRALPGFGPYTAGAVASIAFCIPAAAVDGNAARVLSRLFLVAGDPAAKATRDRLWLLAGELVPGAGAGRPRPGDFNQALIELGATVCRRRSPECRRCPLATLCRARRAGREGELPPVRRRSRRRKMEIACAVVERDGAVLLRRRPERGLFGGLWELPASEVVRGEAPSRAARRALRELGLASRVGGELASVERALTHRDLTLRAFRCEARGMARGPEVRWAGWAEVDGLGMATAMRRLVDLVRPAAGLGSRARSHSSEKIEVDPGKPLTSRDATV